MRAYTANVHTLGTPALYVRFVALALNVSGSKSESGQLRAIIKPTLTFKAWVVDGGHRKVHTKGSDTTPALVPVTDPFETAEASQLRTLVEISGSAGGIEMTLIYQESDTPDDPTSWTTAATGSMYNTEAVNYPTTFNATSWSRRYGRLTASSKNSTGGTEVKAAHMHVRCELRGV